MAILYIKNTQGELVPVPALKGDRGIGIIDTEINDSGELVITYSDGAIDNVGIVKGDKGDSGVYVGSGDMPAGYNIQIDPEGTADPVTAAAPTYELINSFTVSETDVTNEVKGYSFDVDVNNNPFELRAFCVFCDLKPASAAGSIEVATKTAKGNTVSMFKRSNTLSTSQGYYKVDLELKGYWTGRAVLNTATGGTATAQEGYARNFIKDTVKFINIFSDKTLPAGSTIEIYGVRV
jgi:hypothetical protein